MTTLLNDSIAFDRQLCAGLLGFYEGALVCFNDADVTEEGETILFGHGLETGCVYVTLEAFLIDNPNYKEI